MSLRPPCTACSRRSGILKALLDVSIVGDDEATPMPDRPQVRSLLSDPDPKHQLAGLGRDHRRDQLENRFRLPDPRQRRGPDPDAAAPRRADSAAATRAEPGGTLAARAGALRPTLRERDAADIIHALMSPELYRLLVVDRGWRRPVPAVADRDRHRPAAGRDVLGGRGQRAADPGCRSCVVGSRWLCGRHVRRSWLASCCVLRSWSSWRFRVQSRWPPPRPLLPRPRTWPRSARPSGVIRSSWSATPNVPSPTTRPTRCGLPSRRPVLRSSWQSCGDRFSTTRVAIRPLVRDVAEATDLAGTYAVLAGDS